MTKMVLFLLFLLKINGRKKMKYEDIPICIFNSNNGKRIIGFECEDFYQSSRFDRNEIEQFLSNNSENYVFTALSFDLKNPLLGLSSRHVDQQKFPLISLWAPKNVVKLSSEGHEFLRGNKSSESIEFLDWLIEMETNENYHTHSIELKARTSKENYLVNISKIKAHLQRGDIYEMNYCQEFFAENVEISNPLDLYFKLNQLTKSPFSSYLQLNEHLLFCTSPERFIQKKGTHLLSQPIKGTARRGKDEREDQELVDSLRNDPKEKSENIMIVDLVRNDLSKIATKGSVHVDELCEIYSFPAIHQMISTISCELKTSKFTEILEALFPMGSMTGAPKKRALELIDEFEDFNRGLYSGSIGYIDPKGDFDFNVIIRSLIYNKENKRLSCGVGSAITISSDAEKEFEECMVKIEKIRNVIAS